MNTMLLHHDLLPPLYLTDQIPCILFIKRFQWIQTFSIPGKTYRYDWNTLQYRRIFRQFFQTVFQFIPVINPLAEHNLPVHGHITFIKPVNFCKGISGKSIMEHFTAKLGIHSLKRYIDRGKMKLDNTIQIIVTHIGKGNIVSLQEWQSGIVIFKI